MSESERNSSGGGGKGIRGFFNKFRKTSGPPQHNSSSMGIGASRSPASNSFKVGDHMMDAKEVEKILPQLQKKIEDHEKTIRDKDATISGHLKKIAQLETDVKTLQSECDKLRSVLEQKAESAASVNAKTSRASDEVRAQLQQQANMVGQEERKEQAPGRTKKLAVSAEPVDEKSAKGVKLTHHSKPPGAKQIIRDAVQQNDFFRQMDHDQVIEMVECMYEKQVSAGQWVIKEGEAGSHLYVASAGELEVSREGTVLGKMGAGRIFGELAILYNCTRTASVRAVSDVQLYVLDRQVFQMITKRLGMQRHEALMDSIRKVDLLKNLPEDRISRLSEALDQDYFSEGTYIIREGEKGNTFFIIVSGEVKVTQLVEGTEEPQEVRTMKQGDFFGEKALLGEEVRTASVIAMAPGVEVLTLDRESFQQLIGDLKELRRDYKDEERKAQRLKRSSEKDKDSGYAEESGSVAHVGDHGRDKSIIPKADKAFEEVHITDLLSLGTLGVGGFGRVDLVVLAKDKSKTFALKALKKKHIVDTRQQEHIFAERNIMMELRSEWIVRLYKTYRDRKFVYMLMDVCLGGELWTALRDRGHFDDFTARFYVACVLEALEYTHGRNIVYRDLKPENCLLDSTGYLKLVDFGFAKKLASGRKTWTFCGTPEYVSPEIILNKGHDQAADYWALGIYICELLLGRPPFQASDPMKTYTLILKGVDALDIPNRRIGKTVTTLVKKLCRDNPAERLGCQSGGVDDIRKHRWFMGFDWEGLRSRSVRPPIQPKVQGPTDISNFDHYPPDQDVPPDELSGWDEGF